MDSVMVIFCMWCPRTGRGRGPSRGEEGHVGSCEPASLAADLQDLASQLHEHVGSYLRSHSERLRNLGGWGF